MWPPVRVFFILICVVSNFHHIFGNSRLDPLVDSKAGLIRGISASDGSYSMFMGIPYAKVDENNPFGHSIPYPKFENVFEATDDSAICPQLEMFNQTTIGTLDCLHLNVYVPRNATSRNKVPVMVFIHGGFFHRGFAGRYIYGPKYLVRHDVIVVTLNYRVGPYGFMCLDVPDVPGNQGLKDQALALKWVKDNIEAFGGDVHKITLFGQSAGAHSVDFHLIYGDQNLFQNVILQSGSSLAATVLYEPEKSAPQKLAEHMGFTTDSVTEALSFLADSDPNLVIDAAAKLDLAFKPCIEQEFDNVEPYITQTWINVRKPRVEGKPILMGFTEYERILSFQRPDQYINNDDLFRQYLDQIFDFNDEELIEMENLVRQFYLGDEKISEDVRLALVNFDSDYLYVHPMQRSIERYIEAAATNIYYYMFSYVGGRNNGFVIENIPAEAASHSDELGYLFAPQYLDNQDPTPEDEQMIDRMTQMWTNFAKYGNPTPEISDLLPVKWTPLSKENYYYLKIDSEITLERRPAHNRMEFWNLFYMLNEKSQKFYLDVE